MPDEPPAPPLPPVRPQRPPVPGWMWLVFGLTWIPVGALVGALCVSGRDVAPVSALGAGCGFVLALFMCGGLALAARFYSDTAARIFAGLFFAFLLVVAVGGVAFAGCMCVVSQSGGNMFR